MSRPPVPAAASWPPSACSRHHGCPGRHTGGAPASATRSGTTTTSRRPSSSRSWRSTTSTATSSTCPRPARQRPDQQHPRRRRGVPRHPPRRSCEPAPGQRRHPVTVAAGDLIGASPLLSAAFHDEPTIEAMNKLGLEVASVGNHEFDEGYRELHADAERRLPRRRRRQGQPELLPRTSTLRRARTSSTSRPT